MLHWLYIFLFLLISCFITILFLNKQLITLLLIGEVMLVLLFLIGLLISSYYNLFFFVGFSFFILVIGGLELALNLLLLTL